MSGAWVVSTDRHGRDIVVIGTDQIAPAARFAHLDPSTHRWGGSWDARYVLHRDGTASQTHNPKRGRPAVVFSNVQKRPEAARGGPMNPQPDPLHDRITAVLTLFAGGPDSSVRTTWADDGTGALMPCAEVPVADLRPVLDGLRAALAETTAVQPEADAVERAKRVFDQRLADVRDEYHRRQMLWDKERDRLTAALAAAQPVEPEPPRRRMLMTEPHDGHEPEVECPGCPHVEPEPDERDAVEDVYRILRTSDNDGRALVREVIDTVHRSRPEATHTVTAAQVWDAANVADDTVGPDEGFPWYVAFLAALGVTVADTPGGDTCWCPQCGKDH